MDIKVRVSTSVEISNCHAAAVVLVVFCVAALVAGVVVCILWA